MIHLRVIIEGHETHSRATEFTGDTLRDVFEQAGKHFDPIVNPEPVVTEAEPVPESAVATSDETVVAPAEPWRYKPQTEPAETDGV